MKSLLKIKQIAYSLTPESTRNWWRSYKIKRFQSHYPEIISRIKKKEKITVAFFLIHSSVWKYDKLFQLMLADDKFEPVVVICPCTYYGEEAMIRDLKSAEKFVRSKGYPYIMTLNFETGKWFDVKQKITQIWYFLLIRID